MLESVLSKLNKYHLPILDDISYVGKDQAGDQRTLRAHRHALRASLAVDHSESAVRRMGQDLPR
jgi:hypothetical protein